jgi:hypothetical protein
VPIIDVALFSTECLRYRSSASGEAPAHKSVEVSPGIHLAAIKQNVAHVVFHACKFRQLQSDQVMYGFIRYDPPGNLWDADHEISKALYLSHFLHAHEGGFEFAARIEIDGKDRVVDLKAFDVIPCYARAYPCEGISRRWLTRNYYRR